MKVLVSMLYKYANSSPEVLDNFKVTLLVSDENWMQL